MKKLISIILSLIMVIGSMPLIALADENETLTFDQISDENVELDFSAFDSIILLIHDLDLTPYTQDSIDALYDSICSKDNLATQEEIDNAVSKISVAYATLQKRTVSVDFFVIDSNDEFTQTTKSFEYGELAEFRVTDTDESIYKWVISVDDVDTKLDTKSDSISLVVGDNISVTAYTTVEQQITEDTKIVKFKAANGRLVSLVYTNDVENIAMPEAPSVPFYDFCGWVLVDELTYVAQYKMNVACGDLNHVYTITVIKPTCTATGYVLFECPCGETFSTDYVSPTGHSFDIDNEFCLNGCGYAYEGYYENHNTEEKVEEQPQEPVEEPIEEPSDEDYNSLDEGGYANYVIMP